MQINAKLIIYFFCVLLNSFSISSFAAEPLPVDSAFNLSVKVTKPNEVLVEWKIAPNYYLYAKRLAFTFNPEVKADIRIPQGEYQFDKRGRFEAFSGLLSVPIQLETNQQQLQMKVNYQGCAKDGFCYPPTQKNILLNLQNQTASVDGNTVLATSKNKTITSLLTDQHGVQNLLKSQTLPVTLLFFVGLGLLLAFTPCVLPMIPILTGIIVGQKKSISAQKAFLLSLVYVLGSAIMYAVAGVIAAAVGSSLQVWLQQPWIIATVSALFALLALSLFGFYEVNMPQALQHRIINLSNKQRSGTYAGVFLMGVLSALIVSPCVTAPLVGVLLYVSETGNLLLGGSALFVMALGMGIPLLFIGTSAGKWLPRSGPWMEAIKRIFGILMLAMAIWMLSRIISPEMTLIFWGLLLIGIALFFSIYLSRLIGKHVFNRAIGLIVGLVGILFIASAFMPTIINFGMLNNQQQISHSFVVVNNIAELKQQLAVAKEAEKPVIIDFYADWCESCLTMERNVFGSSEVKQELKNYVLIRADLTDNTEDEQVLLKKFNVIAPPTILFFNSKGKEIQSQRIVGEVDAKEFLTRLNLLMAADCDKKVNC